MIPLWVVLTILFVVSALFIGAWLLIAGAE